MEWWPPLIAFNLGMQLLYTNYFPHSVITAWLSPITQAYQLSGLKIKLKDDHGEEKASMDFNDKSENTKMQHEEIKHFRITKGLETFLIAV